MIKIATAECFTHGFIAREIHAISKRYEGELGSQYYNKYLNNEILSNVIVVCGIFIPTVSGLEKILKIDVPSPLKIINGVKVYDEKTDKKVAVLMAKAVMNITDADIGIGTTAGIGKGGIALSNGKITIVTNSDSYANLLIPCSAQILKRQRDGIKKAVSIFLDMILYHDLNKIKREYKDVDILDG